MLSLIWTTVPQLIGFCVTEPLKRSFFLAFGLTLLVPFAELRGAGRIQYQAEAASIRGIPVPVIHHATATNVSSMRSIVLLCAGYGWIRH